MTFKHLNPKLGDQRITFFSCPLYVCTKVESAISDSSEIQKLKVTIKSQENRIARLQAGIEELKRHFRENNDRSSASIKFELNDVSEFFNGQNVRSSQRVWCRGMQWSILLEKSEDKAGLKYLDIFLCCHNDEKMNWSCEVDFKLILFNHLSGDQNRVTEYRGIFEQENDNGQGQFIEYSELTDEQNGFIKDDQIVVGVELTAKPVVREQ